MVFNDATTHSWLSTAKICFYHFGQSLPTLAVAGFVLLPAGALSPLNADNAREDITTAVIKTKAFSVVERGQLDKALVELNLGAAMNFDAATAQKLGRLVNAQAILIGSISDRGTYAVIDARIIETQTWTAVAAASVEIQQ